MPKDQVGKDFKSLVDAVKANIKHMDQWEKFKFETPSGMIYVSITYHDLWPDSFEKIDPETGKILEQGGIIINN